MAKNKNHLHKVAAIQMCSSYDIDENLNTATRLITQAAQAGAKLIVLPENFAFMGRQPTDCLTIKESMGAGKIQSTIAALAKEQKVWLIGGSIPIATHHDNKVRSACIIYNEQGEVAARYDKIHLFDATVSATESHHESRTVESGENIVVIDTPIGKLGIVICFDIRFPYLFTEMLAQQVEIIAIPAAFTVPTGKAHWHILTRARAIDTFSFIIAANQGGEHANGRKTYGHSMIIDPWGNVLCEQVDNTPSIIIAEIDLSLVAKSRTLIPIQSKS